MGFLHKLWDETLAGPAPDTGLAKLRKYDSFSGSCSGTGPGPGPGLVRTSSGPPEALVRPGTDHEVRVTRSITIVRSNSTPLVTNNNFSVEVPGSDPNSPSPRCTTPRTPLTPGTPAGENFKKWTRRKSPQTDAFERADQTSRTVYDWIVISALDR